MFTKIVVPLDSSTLAEQAIGPAASIARISGASLALVLVHKPIPFGGFTDAPWNANEWQTARAYLESIAAEVRTGASVEVTWAVVHGEPSDKISEYARDVRADLIVMTSHGRTGFSRAWLGSVAQALLRHSPVPMLMVRPVETSSEPVFDFRLPSRMLVTLDGSELARGIIPGAVAFARVAKSRLFLLRVVEPVPLPAADIVPARLLPAGIDEVTTQRMAADARRDVAHLADSLIDDGFMDVETAVVIAQGVAQAILDFAKDHDIDAIAMATHGRGVSRFFVGSVADKVLRATTLPMLLQRPLEMRYSAPLIDEESIEEQLTSLSGL